jgi:Group II intron, maturase-specific domain
MGPAMRGWFQISQLPRGVIAKAYLGYRPSKSIQGMVENAHALTVRSGVGKIPRGWLGKLNRTLRGWSNYFAVGTVTKPYWAIDNYTAVRLRRWLRFKHKIRRRLTAFLPPRHGKAEDVRCFQVHLTETGVGPSLPGDATFRSRS